METSGPPVGEERLDSGRAGREALGEAALLEHLLEVYGPCGCERCGGTGAEPGDEDIDCGDCGGAGQIASLGHPKFLEHAGLLQLPGV